MSVKYEFELSGPHDAVSKLADAGKQACEAVDVVWAETCKLTTDVQTSTLENYNAISKALRKNMTPGVLYSVKVSHGPDEDGIDLKYEWPGNDEPETKPEGK